MDKELNKLRQKIDLLDDKILSSILERAKIVDSVAKIKGVEGVEIIRPGREINLLVSLDFLCPVEWAQVFLNPSPAQPRANVCRP